MIAGSLERLSVTSLKADEPGEGIWTDDLLSTGASLVLPLYNGNHNITLQSTYVYFMVLLTNHLLSTDTMLTDVSL